MSAGPVAAAAPVRGMTRSYAAPLDAVDHLHVGPDGTVVAVKEIRDSDPYLVGHYPGFPIYPGVFSIETVYQAARAVIEVSGSRAEVAGMRSVRFSAPLLPGDVLTARLELGRPGPEDDLVRVSAVCRRGDGQTSARITMDLRLRRTEETGV